MGKMILLSSSSSPLPHDFIVWKINKNPDGKDLIVTTFGDQQRVFDIFKNIIQNDFGNNVTVNIDKSGLVSFVLAEGAVLSGVQQRLYDAYSMLLAPGSKTTISLTEKSSKTLIGGFDISLGDDGKNIKTLSIYRMYNMLQLKTI
ncbi:hypothetical protein [Chryseobacterium gambrini]|uniref:Uncharacterized protein n=1 Tax=Chryseobacterium gambrini TaxID=373672 RepID=A0ABM8K3E2_9FLAO|nr:hypothetical protein CRDW_08290 [Chryseobacterium gambrini]